MYYIRPRDHKNVLLQDIGLSLRAYNDGTIISDKQYNESLNIKQLESDLIIIHIDDEITNSLVKRELYYISENNQIIKLKKGKYEPNNNTISVFLNGKILNTTNFIEINEDTIQLKNKIKGNKDIVIVQYVDKIIMPKVGSQFNNISIEKYTIEPDQVIIELQTEISSKQNEIILLFIDGVLQNNNCFKLNNSKELEFLAPLGTRCIVTIVNFDILKMI